MSIERNIYGHLALLLSPDFKFVKHFRIRTGNRYILFVRFAFVYETCFQFPSYLNSRFTNHRKKNREVRCYIRSSAFFSSTLTLSYQFDVPHKRLVQYFTEPLNVYIHVLP
jgi:hypothetical protein